MSNKIEITPFVSMLSVEMGESGTIYLTRTNRTDEDDCVHVEDEEVDKLIHAIELLRKNQKEAGNVN